MRQRDGQRHQLGRLAAGVAEHHALVARAARVHAHRDVGALLVDVGDYRARLCVEAIGGVRIADIPDHIARHLLQIHIRIGGDLAHNVHKARAGRCLAGHAAVWILLQHCVQNRIRDLIADLIGMPLGDGFGCKQFSCHLNFSLSPKSGAEKV